MHSATRIRPPREEDAAAFADLLEQLGYPSSPAQVAQRLGHLAAAADAAVFVAEREGAVCGLATVHAHAALNRDEPAVQLTLLVVSAALRGSGTGRRLVEAAERWALQCGATRLVVTTAVHRAGAHQFYERLGYALTGRRYARVLAAGG